MEVADVQRMRQLVQENARLKRIVVRRGEDIEIDLCACDARAGAMKDLLSQKW